ncbi:hypothetical protein [Nonomuraea longicatena]|uniref:Uncharacterized protein n=1 Tax=Nonomuraea longicatena TaxID=83682 RepID=A0ABP4BXM0_9ACTN
MRVNKKYGFNDITALHIEGSGRLGIVPGSLTLIDERTVAFIDEFGDQVNVMSDRLIASECAPIDDDASDGDSQ